MKTRMTLPNALTSSTMLSWKLPPNRSLAMSIKLGFGPNPIITPLKTERRTFKKDIFRTTKKEEQKKKDGSNI